MALFLMNASFAKKLAALEKLEEDTARNMDIFFIITNSMIVFLMQCGFAFLEAGAVSSKNTTNILLKNVLNSLIGCLAYWALGFALAYGKGSSFVGGHGFFGTFDDKQLANFFFQMVFAATSSSIVSGAVAERCELIAYLTCSVVLTAFGYPVISRWAWHDGSSAQDPTNVGWLIDGVSIIPGAKYQDFAGSGVVHVCGGVAALCGAILLGPRIGRFDENGKPLSLPGHSVPLAALGGFILVFGFFAFNGGSQNSISTEGDGIAVERAITNTIISGSSAGIAIILLHRVFSATVRSCVQQSTWSLLTTLNGVLAGMVANGAGANVMHTWGACVTGVIAAIVYYFGSMLVLRLRIDDPLDAISVHGFGGTWGLIAAPLLGIDGIILTGSRESAETLAMNLIGWLAIVGWTAAISIPMFGLLRLCGMLRVDKDIELKGLDIPKHGEPAYPAEAWGDGWGSYLESTSNGLGTWSTQPSQATLTSNTHDGEATHKISAHPASQVTLQSSTHSSQAALKSSNSSQAALRSSNHPSQAALRSSTLPDQPTLRSSSSHPSQATLGISTLPDHSTLRNSPHRSPAPRRSKPEPPGSNRPSFDIEEA